MRVLGFFDSLFGSVKKGNDAINITPPGKGEKMKKLSAYNYLSAMLKGYFNWGIKRGMVLATTPLNVERMKKLSMYYQYT